MTAELVAERLGPARTGGMHPDDEDLWLARGYGVDPVAVAESWPLSLRRRAVAVLEAEQRARR